MRNLIRKNGNGRITGTEGGSCRSYGRLGHVEKYRGIEGVYALHGEAEGFRSIDLHAKSRAEEVTGKGSFKYTYKEKDGTSGDQ